MTANEYTTIIDFEASLTPGQKVMVQWTAGSAGRFSSNEAVVKRVNRASVRVVLTADWSYFPAGREIVVPLFADSGLARWTCFNRVEPVDGY